MGKLKLLCQRLFRVPAARQALFLKAGGENPMPDNIGQDDSKDLMFFSVEVRSLSFLVSGNKDFMCQAKSVAGIG